MFDISDVPAPSNFAGVRATGKGAASSIVDDGRLPTLEASRVEAQKPSDCIAPCVLAGIAILHFFITVISAILLLCALAT